MKAHERMLRDVQQRTLGEELGERMELKCLWVEMSGTGNQKNPFVLAPARRSWMHVEQ